MASNSIRTILGTSRSDSLTGATVPEQRLKNENLYPQNPEQLENPFNEKSEADSRIGGGEETFWVTKTADAKQLSRSLLKENFGFSDEDCAAYVKRYGEMMISDERKCDGAKLQNKACQWAAPADIKNWKSVGGKVSIDLTAETVNQIQNFKRERTIDAAIGKITDPFLRETVKADLLKLANGDGQARIDAAERLAHLEVETPNDVEAVRDSIRAAAQEPLNKNNAALQVLSAKVDLNRALADRQNAFTAMVNSAPNDYEKNVNYQTLEKRVTAYEARLQRAIDAARGVDAETGRRLPNAKINRAEAAYVNRQIADLYRALGKEEKAAERETLVRYYQIDEAERKTFFRPRVTLDGTIYGGGYFSRYKTAEMKSAEPNSPTALPQGPPQKKDLQETPFKFEYKVTDKIDNQGKIVRDENTKKIKVVESNYQIEGSLKTSDKLTVSNYEYFDEKGRKVPEGMPYKLRNERQTKIPPSELNKAGTTRAFVTSGRVGALQEFNNWFPIVVDVLVTNKSLDNRLTTEAAKREAFFQKNYPVPPEPKDLPRIKLKLEQQYGKEATAVLMRKLEEMSYAAWGNQ